MKASPELRKQGTGHKWSPLPGLLPSLTPRRGSCSTSWLSSEKQRTSLCFFFSAERARLTPVQNVPSKSNVNLHPLTAGSQMCPLGSVHTPPTPGKSSSALWHDHNIQSHHQHWLLPVTSAQRAQSTAEGENHHQRPSSHQIHPLPNTSDVCCNAFCAPWLNLVCVQISGTNGCSLPLI